jgi:hypothetical protein
VTVAVVFGSNAKGTERAGSDIDVLVVTTSSVSELKVNTALRPVGRKHNRSINAVVYTGAEFEHLLQAQDCFALDVACNPTIPLIGDFGALVSAIRTQRSNS